MLKKNLALLLFFCLAGNSVLTIHMLEKFVSVSLRCQLPLGSGVGLGQGEKGSEGLS